MLKRLLALILSLSMMFSYPMPEAKAAELNEFRLPVIRINDNYTNDLNVLSDDEHVYIRVEDLASLAHFQGSQIDTDDNGVKMITLLKDSDQLDSPNNIWFFPQEQTAFSTQKNKTKFDGCITYEDQVYFDILKIFEYLNIKSDIFASDLVVNIPQYTILDFLNYDYNDALASFVTQYDLLEEDESLLTSGLWDSLGVVLKNFDLKLLIPFLGSSTFRHDQLTQVLSTLNEPDSLYYDPETTPFLNTMLEKRGLNKPLLAVDSLFQHMGLDVKLKASSSVSDVASLLIDSDSSTTMKFLDFVGINTDTLESAAKMGDVLPYVDLGFDVYNALIYSSEVYSRAQKWTDDCANDMDILRNLPIELYAPKSKGQNIVKEIKAAADTCYNEKLYPELFTTLETSNNYLYNLDVKMLSTLLGEVGVVANVFTSVVSLGVSAAENFESVKNSLDNNQMSFMTTLMIHVADAARINARNEYVLFKSTGDTNHLKNFRDSMTIALKCNLRCWSFIYTTNSDGTWENSALGKNAKDKISNAQTYLMLLQETEKYDYLMDEYHIDYTVEDLTAVLKEPIDYEALYAPIIQEYKDAVDNDMYEKANGLRENAPNVNVELGGYSQLDFSLNYAYIDLNEDELPELLIAKEVQQTDMTSNLDKIGYLIFDMYTCVNGTAERIFDIYSMGYRKIYHICKDNLIRCYEDGGMNASGIYFYQLQPNSNTVEEVMRYRYNNDEYPPYTKTTSEGTVEINSDIFRSEGLSQDLLKTDIEWIPLASHVSSKPETNDSEDEEADYSGDTPQDYIPEEPKSVSDFSDEELCQIVVDHYNAAHSTTDFVAFDFEVMPWHGEIIVPLRTTGRKDANVLVDSISINPETGDVKSDILKDDPWNIFD